MAYDDDVARFVRELKERGGFDTWADFAREASVLSSSLSNWQRGAIEPWGSNLVKLIWAAQRRQDQALHEAARSTDPDGAEVKIAAYRELVAALERDSQEQAQHPPEALSSAAAELIAEIRALLVDKHDELDVRLARLEAAQALKEQSPSQPAEVSR